MNKAPSAILCPYCGHTQRNMDVCEACGGRFDPVSRRGVQISMGPWHLHDERVPFRPGFSFTAVQRLIIAGKLKSDSLIKGPTTKQLWKTARKTAGLAHLLGYCHACGREAFADAQACSHCQATFPQTTPHNELGVPYATPQEAADARAGLDRSIQRTGGESTRINLEHHPSVGALTLCPYCGQWQKSDERCQSCGGLFDAYSLEATLIAMGPWFVRNKRFPYIPGCSFEILRKQIDAGRIDGSTILRGPTTRQFWAVARNVPGLSHLVGSCYHCAAKARANDAKCEACGVEFPKVGGQNVLGLAFTSEAEAIAAEKQLEAQYNLTAPPTPIAPPIPTSVSGDTTSHAETGVNVLSGLDRAAMAVLATAPVDTAPVMPEPAQTAPARTSDASKSAKPGSFMLFAGIAAGAVIGLVVLIALLSRGSSNNEQPPTPTTNNQPAPPKPDDSSKQSESIVDTALRARSTIRTTWNRVETLDREGMIGLRIESAWESIQRADALLNDDAYEKALALYERAKVDLDDILEQSKLREDARQARFEAEQQMDLIRSATLPVDLELELESIQFKFDEGTIHFFDGSYDKACETWKSVSASASAILEKSKTNQGVQADP